MANPLRHLLVAGALTAPLALAAADAGAATVLETLKEDPQFSRLVALIEEAGIAEELSGEGPLTLLAPTNDAFTVIPERALQRLKDEGLLADVLKHHLILGEAYGTDRLEGLSVSSGGGGFAVETNDAGVLRVYQDGAELTRLGENLVVRHTAPYRPTAEAPRPPVPPASAEAGSQGQVQGDPQQAQGQAEAEPTSDADKQQQTAASYALGESVSPDERDAEPRNTAQEQRTAASADPQVQDDQGQGVQQVKDLAASPPNATPDPMVVGMSKPEQRGNEPSADDPPAEAPQQAAAPETEQKTYLGPGEDPSQDKKVRIAQVARVVVPDIEADNGIIQGVDRMLLTDRAVTLFEPRQTAQAGG